jgi:hypothetical protein
MVRSAATPRVSNHGVKKGAILTDGPFSTSDAAVVLLDDLDNAAGPRLDQNRAAVHDGVAIIPGAVFRRYVVIGDALLRQNRANSDVLAILIGRTTLLDDVTVKAGTLVDAQDAGDATDHAADDTADHGADRTGSPFAISRAPLNPTGNPLGLGHHGQRHGGDKGSYSDKTADHDISNDVG